MIRVLIADDHAVVRRGLREILEEERDIQVVREARNGQEVTDVAGARDCDVVVLDISMPGKSGLEVLRDLRKQQPKLPVLMLSIHPEEQFGVRALRAGAAGYLTKEAAPEELVKGIRKASKGEKFVTPSLAERLATEVELQAEKAPHEGLSNREFQILQMIASGKTVSEIATGVCLSVKTISTYRARILAKMGMKTNAELTHYAIENELV